MLHEHIPFDKTINGLSCPLQRAFVSRAFMSHSKPVELKTYDMYSSCAVEQGVRLYTLYFTVD